MISLLLDTNIVIWAMEGDERLPLPIAEQIRIAPQVFVSVLSVWEIAIKRGKGKLNIVPDYVEYILRSGFMELPATYEHARRVETLPPIHGDPFDRLLVAQAICENLTIVTADAHIPHYNVKTLIA